MTASKTYDNSEALLGDDLTHSCSIQVDGNPFDQLNNKDKIYSRGVDLIRTVLKAFQVQFGEEIEKAGELKSRAIYSVEVECNESSDNFRLLRFGFDVPKDFDYKVAFNCLFFDDSSQFTLI